MALWPYFFWGLKLRGLPLDSQGFSPNKKNDYTYSGDRDKNYLKKRDVLPSVLKALMARLMLKWETASTNARILFYVSNYTELDDYGARIPMSQ